jgi:hypothetical protein
MEAWQTYARERGWTTHVTATPRVALHGSVSVEPARGWRRLEPAGFAPSGFTVGQTPYR